MQFSKCIVHFKCPNKMFEKDFYVPEYLSATTFFSVEK